MRHAVWSETLKFRRTFVRWLLVLGPLVLVLYARGIPPLAGRTRWETLLLVVGNWWSVLFVPFGVALLASLAEWQEQRSGAWRTLRAHPVDPATLYGAKLLTLVGLAGIGTLVLGAVVLVVGALWAAPGELVPWTRIGLAVGLSWLTALPLLALHLWLATATGYGWSFALALPGLLGGVLMAEHPAWLVVPWAWPIRALIPVVGGHANGLPLEAGSALWDASAAVIAVALALPVAGLLGYAGARWFAHQEVV